MRKVNVQRLRKLIRAEVNGAIPDDSAVDFEREQVANDLKPRRSGAALSILFGRRIHKIQFRLFHEKAANHSMMQQRIPLNREINALRRKERDGHETSGFADANVINRIGPAQQMNLHFANVPEIERVAVERAVHVIADSPWEKQPRNGKKDGQNQQHKSKLHQTAVSARRMIAGMGLSFHIKGVPRTYPR